MFAGNRLTDMTRNPENVHNHQTLTRLRVFTTPLRALISRAKGSPLFDSLMYDIRPVLLCMLYAPTKMLVNPPYVSTVQHAGWNIVFIFISIFRASPIDSAVFSFSLAFTHFENTIVMYAIAERKLLSD